MKSFYAGRNYLLHTFSLQLLSALNYLNWTELWTYKSAKFPSAAKWGEYSVLLSADQITQIPRHHMSHYLGHSSS